MTGWFQKRSGEIQKKFQTRFCRQRTSGGTSEKAEKSGERKLTTSIEYDDLISILLVLSYSGNKI